MAAKIKRINEYCLEVPLGYVEGMKVPGIIYVNQGLEQDLEEEAIHQVANTATLPGIVKASLAMPDIHTGYGFPIGGVAAIEMTNDGVVSPGGVGYDINCGVRLLRSNLTKYDISPRLKELVNQLYRDVPSGVGSTGRIKLSKEDERNILKKGSRWAVENGYGLSDDLIYTESNGCLDGADIAEISKKALERGREQVGTLGSGNHFLEVQYVEEVYDQQAASAYGLFPEQIVVMIHSGSRGFGHQVCTDFLVVMSKAVKKYGINLPDRELACAPIFSPEAQSYLSAMKAAANYAWANRQCMSHWVREAFQRFFKISPSSLNMGLVYDVAHNIAKEEEHIIDGMKKRVLVHRKGATRAFAKGHPELPLSYKDIGQPVIIPGDMGRASYVLCGSEKAMETTYGSACHGAGRLLSRHKAIQKAKGRFIEKELEEQGIFVRSAGKRTLAEEISEAYKDVTDVVDVVDKVGIAKKVAKLRPLGVVKG
jgi:tRNA-splicing ligase RtcB